jgi:hypothetical protein
MKNLFTIGLDENRRVTLSADMDLPIGTREERELAIASLHATASSAISFAERVRAIDKPRVSRVKLWWKSLTV